MAHKSVVTALLGTCGVFAMALSDSGSYAGALPSSGHFVSGKGEIGKGAQSLTVKQSSTTGIIDWNSFSIGKHQGVTFDNGTGATLNRVTGGNLSTIAGSLHATGSLYLLNSSGVIVNGSGRIVSGGRFVASSGSLSNSAFNDGQHRFGGTDGGVVNRGSITSGGWTKLVGSSAVNTGTITAPYVKLRATSGEALAGGTIDAVGSAHQPAHILVTSDTGETKVIGTLATHNQDGGTIETSGRHVSIGGNIDAGKGGAWLIDPENLTVDSVAASTIEKSLNAGTSVTLRTTKTAASGPGTQSSGAGDIIVAANVSWSSNAQLTFDSYRSVLIDAHVAITGGGRLGLVYDDGGSSGDLAFDNGNVTFAKTSDILGINRVQYELVDDIKALAADIAKSPNGHYALAESYNATADGTYTVSPITKTFAGSFNGLGNAISNLTIENSSASSPIGLFSEIASGGTIAGLALTSVNIVGGTAVGGLVGQNEGLLTGDSIGGIVTGNTYVGGLAGTNTGTMKTDSSAASVVDTHGTQQPNFTGSLVGGLVGYNEHEGAISNSFATGSIDAVNSSDVGGLVGRNSGTLTSSWATGAAHGFNATGGLAGNSPGTIDQSWASGQVQGMRYVGGLVGFTDAGLTEQSYATGNVIADAGGKYEGGLVGYIGAKGKIENAYARGNVKGNILAGGIAGMNEGEIVSSYSIGAVTGTKQIGGSLGEDNGKVSNVYWNTQTAGTTHAIGLLDAGATGTPDGRTTTQLRAALLKGFSSAVWGLSSRINNGLPYLVALKSSY